MKSIKKFQYRPAQKLVGWGYSFDSLTEVKFTISVMEEYAFMRSPVSMYFNPASGQITPFPRLFHRRYTPDFLIRNLETREAFLIEIKPRAFQGNDELKLHETAANNYIRALKFDWIYKVVFDDEIILTEDQLNDFKQFLRLKGKTGRYKWFTDYLRKMSALPGRLTERSNAHIDFVMRGWTTGQPNLFTRQ